MDINRKYMPLNSDEWVGDIKILQDLEEYIVNSIPVILYGNSGTGKTSSVYLVANKLGYKVIEVNSSDERRKQELNDLKARLRIKTFSKIILLFDESDGVDNQDLLLEAISGSIHPVVLTANDVFKLSPELRKLCKEIEVNLKPSQIGLVVNRMKQIAEKEGVEVSFTGVTTDVRESINKVFLKSSGYTKDTNYFEKVEALFKRGKVDDIPPIWLLDNITNFYFGKDLYDAMKIIKIYAEEKDKEILRCLPRAKGGRCEYPYCLKKMRKMNGYS